MRNLTLNIKYACVFISDIVIGENDNYIDFIYSLLFYNEKQKIYFVLRILCKGLSISVINKVSPSVNDFFTNFDINTLIDSSLCFTSSSIKRFTKKAIEDSFLKYSNPSSMKNIGTNNTNWQYINILKESKNKDLIKFLSETIKLRSFWIKDPFSFTKESPIVALTDKLFIKAFYGVKKFAFCYDQVPIDDGYYHTRKRVLTRLPSITLETDFYFHIVLPRSFLSLINRHAMLQMIKNQANPEYLMTSFDRKLSLCFQYFYENTRLKRIG